MKSIAFFDITRAHGEIRDGLDAAFASVVGSGYFIQGAALARFEEEFAKYCGTQHAIGVGNGLDALTLILRGYGIGPGDEVIVPSFTYVATAEVIGLLQLKPVMVDVDPYSFNITAESISLAITNKTKAIVPVHLFGQCADMEPILALAKERGLYVIEDTAQALGASYTFKDGSINR